MIAPYVPLTLPPTGYQPYLIAGCLIRGIPYRSIAEGGTVEAKNQYAKIHNGGNQWVFCIGPQCALAPDVFVRGRHQGRCRACWCKLVQGRTWHAAAKVATMALCTDGEKES